MNKLRPRANVLTFIINLITLYNKGKQNHINIFNLKNYNKKIKLFNNQTKHHDPNSANQMGDSFEELMKDIFANSLFNTLNDSYHNNRDNQIHNIFSYPGNDKDLPDAMIKNGDCLEFKKVSKHPSTIQLNSSYPHSKMLLHDSATTTSEDWKNALKSSKRNYADLVYVIGHEPTENKIDSIFMSYGCDIAKDNKDYATIKKYFQKSTTKSINKSINRFPYLRNKKTTELGHLQNIDKLGQTYLRIRGMWVMKDPLRIFINHFQKPRTKKDGSISKNQGIKKDNFFKKHDFAFALIIRDTKLQSFSVKSKLRFKTLKSREPCLTQKPISIKDPNNTNNLIHAQLIQFYIN